MNNIHWYDAFLFGTGMSFSMIYLNMKEYIRTKEIAYITMTFTYVILMMIFTLMYFLFKGP